MSLLGVYVNLGLAVRKYIKAGKSADARKVLLNFYDVIALNQDHDDVEINQFEQLTQKYRHKVKTKKKDFETAGECFVSIGQPPPRASQPIVPIEQRTSTDGETIEEDLLEALDDSGLFDEDGNTSTVDRR